MEEAVMYGVAVALLMLGVPLWHSMGECRRGRLVRVRLARWWLLCGLLVMLSLLLTVMFGVAGFVIRNSGATGAARVSADCKILSTGVDIRATEVCEGDQMAHLLKIKQNSNLPSKFRCSLDYYWTSVLKVEYMPRSSKSALQADVEVPSEPIPLKCRPDFHAAQRTTQGYEINGTYPCTYSSKNLKIVDMTAQLTGNCITERDWSNSDVMRQFWYMLLHSEYSLFSRSGKISEVLSRALSAVGLGICYSVIVTGFTRTLRQVHFHFEHGEHTDLDVVYFEARIQLAILFIALLFGVIWVSNCYLGETYSERLQWGTL